MFNPQSIEKYLNYYGINKIVSIKSSFFPKEALQGEDLPAHVIWSDLEYDFIKIELSDSIRFKEGYNVSSDSIEISENLVIIKNVEVDGYLGLVFSSEILSDNSAYREVKLSFLYNNDVIESLCFNVYLFRPDIVIDGIPENILVNIETGVSKEKILVKNLGDGTAIIDIETVGESELQKHYPEFLKRFIEEYIEGVKFGISKLKEDFEDFKDLLDKVEKYLLYPPKYDEQSLNEFKDFMGELEYALEKRNELGDALSEMLVEIIIRNTEFSNFYQLVSEYINSIGKHKILLRDPFNVITLSNKPANLKIQIKCIDLLKQMCVTISPPSIQIYSDKHGEVALFKLFHWGEKE